jgi:tRNA-dihydrouridine synthase A
MDKRLNELNTPPLFSPLAIAPMIDWTYVHFRVLMRMLAPYALLYTEMQTTGAIAYNPARALEYIPEERPLALQIGGSDKVALVESAKQAEAAGFSEVNINLGCPSDRVQAGRFGACLMAEPQHVADCIHSMKQAVSIPITAKTRIGIDEQDSYEYFSQFAHALVEAGCDKLIVHARKAWLKGLSPKQNRTIPPLHYDYVYRIKAAFADLPVVINGNIQTLDEVNSHLQHVDGVMLGRLACQNPYRIAEIHHALYPEVPLLSRAVIFERYLDYIMSLKQSVTGLGVLIKPILNLTHGLPGSRAWREQLVQIQQAGEVRALVNIASLIKKIERGVNDCAKY